RLAAYRARAGARAGPRRDEDVARSPAPAPGLPGSTGRRRPMNHRLCEHGPLQRFAQGVFCMTGDSRSLERPRRVTLFALEDGRLVIHGGIRLRDDEMTLIDSLGEVAFYLLVPNAHHDPDA